MNLPDSLSAEHAAASVSVTGKRPSRLRFGLAVECLVGIAILVGAIRAVQSGRERSELRTEYQRLVRKVGELAISDTTKVWVSALETGDPMHFAWRVYLPANHHFRVRHQGGSSSSNRPDSAEFVARVRFRMSDSGHLQVYGHYGSGSHLGSRGSGEVAQFIQQHWERFQIEQLGSEGAVSLEPTDSATLLRITVPDDLQAEMRELLSPHASSEFVPEYFAVHLGPSRSNP